MKKLKKMITIATLASAMTALCFPGIAFASETKGLKILEARFNTRTVVKVDAGDFHFTAGQIAPIHTHEAPAVGYVMKGEIIYQVEGKKQVLLREGDAFYEPAGPRILRFDNASATEEAIFIDFNIQRSDDPFIVFEKPPTEAIDRRTLPTTNLGSQNINKVEVFEHHLVGNQEIRSNFTGPVVNIVAEGVVLVQEQGKPEQRVGAGGTFASTLIGNRVTIRNASSQASAKIIAFHLQ